MNTDEIPLLIKGYVFIICVYLCSSVAEFYFLDSY
jgi:hypothetical protein